jgi:hypothetical protein
MFDAGVVELELPGGYRDAQGDLHREVVLAAPTGREEETLASHPATRPAQVTALLDACVRRVGAFEPVTADLMRGLLVADRAYLMLRLRQFTVGDRILVVLTCPSCSRPMDLDFEVGQIPIVARRPESAIITYELPAEAAFVTPGGTPIHAVRFRLPTGEDEEALAARPAMTEAEGIATLLERCLVQVGPISPVNERIVAAIPFPARDAIDAAMERVAPEADVELEVGCPECGHGFVHPFDCAALLLEELQLQSSQLYRDVHRLALRYHWAESEILGLTRTRRRTYLALLNEEEAAPTAAAAER